MNNIDFKQHFINFCEYINIENYEKRNYIVCPVLEYKKSYTSIDDILRHLLLPKQRTLKFEEVIHLFTWKEGYYPLWIKVVFIDKDVVLYTSLRLRKVSSSSNTNFYPFKIR